MIAARLFSFLISLGTTSLVAAPIDSLVIEKDEYWWGGWTSDGHRMPFTGETTLTRNLHGDNGGNQAQPLLLSNRGRYIWSDEPFLFDIKDGRISFHGASAIELRVATGGTLASGFRDAALAHFPPDGRLPAVEMFKAPQYNTWIELMYDQNQSAILDYARSIVAQGYPPGVLMIDDNWQADYGVWQFSRDRFSDPKRMVEELHSLGFKVMLWVCPYVSPDSEVYRDLAKRRLLIRERIETRPGKFEELPAIIKWWNGRSAALDLTHPDARLWFTDQLDRLVRDYGIDGFKFDAGDTDHFRDHYLAESAKTPNDQTRAFAEIGLLYPYNEYRATWKMAGRGLAQRLRDKKHVWSDLEELVPGILAQGVLGYAYTCPDMIGGGDFVSFLDGAPVDQELVVRSAQVHALMPMMQFSVAPWRVLSQENNTLCREMARLHRSMGDQFVELARESSRTGDPIVRPLTWEWPTLGYEAIVDQFMVGSELMVAPVLKKGARTRSVAIPPGRWRADTGEIFVGPSRVDVDAPLARLPYFIRIN